MIYKTIVAVPDLDAFAATYELSRNPPAFIEVRDEFISAGRDESGQPRLYHVDALHGYEITQHGIMSVSGSEQIPGLAAIHCEVSNGPVMLAMEQDIFVCVLGAEDVDGNPAQSAQGPIGRHDPLTDERWDEVVRPTLLMIYPALEGPMDSYRAAHPECTPLEVWVALRGWMKANANSSSGQ